MYVADCSWTSKGFKWFVSLDFKTIVTAKQHSNLVRNLKAWMRRKAIPELTLIWANDGKRQKVCILSEESQNLVDMIGEANGREQIEVTQELVAQRLCELECRGTRV